MKLLASDAQSHRADLNARRKFSDALIFRLVGVESEGAVLSPSKPSIEIVSTFDAAG